MRRRDFITLAGGITVGAPLAVRAQETQQLRRIGVLMYWAATSEFGLAAFKKALQQAGWTEGVNARFDIRFSDDSPERGRRFAAELVALAPDVILASATPSVVALQSLTSKVPIVFVAVSDPVGAGVVESIARPGGQRYGLHEF
jgi:putative ABC transport system substrate-binding protein